MKQIEKLLKGIVGRVNVNLRNPAMDVTDYVMGSIAEDSFSQFYAFYALSANHPLSFSFRRSSLAGTYFLGKCEVDSSVLYKTDVRGDELKQKGTVVKFGDTEIKLVKDEHIRIQNSFLLKTLVHNNSHNPEDLETFNIHNTVSMHYANIHGACVEGCFIGPFATVDLSTFHDCIIGDYSYVQAGDLSHVKVEPGRIWVKADQVFEFNYKFPEGAIEKYIRLVPGQNPTGVFIDFLENREKDFMPIYSTIQSEHEMETGEGSHVSPYAVIKGDCKVGQNVLVAQRAYVENSSMGDGANAQENCYIINSTYDGLDVTAHGGKVIWANVGQKVFTGFNSFLNGKKDAQITIGKGCIIMPHTIIDSDEAITIPENTLVWGYITKQADLELNSIGLEEFSATKSIELGNMTFSGSGKAFVEGFQHRIEHILEENGAYYDGTEETRGHAQKTRNVSFNIIQPGQEGDLEGVFPSIIITPNDPLI